MKPKTLLLALLATGLSATCAEAVVYAGNTRTGFGGTVGNGSLSVTDNGTNLTFTFTRGSGSFNDFLVIYFDSTTGGATSLPASGEVGSPFSGRRAIVNEFGSGVAFGGGFATDFAFALKANGSTSNHLFDIQPGDNANDLGFITTAAVSNFGNTTAATYTWSISLAALGLSPGDSFDFVTTYLNPNDGGGSDATFRSNESFAYDLGASNPGFAGVTFSSFQTYSTVPEPAAALLGSLGILALLRRRK